jgi:hypothetical protein
MDSNPFAGGQCGDAFDPPNANPYTSYAPDDSLPPAMESDLKVSPFIPLLLLNFSARTGVNVFLGTFA